VPGAMNTAGMNRSSRAVAAPSPFSVNEPKPPWLKNSGWSSSVAGFPVEPPIRLPPGALSLP
jgi:hypothetical protein